MDLSIKMDYLASSYGRLHSYTQLTVMNGYEINVSNYIELTWTYNPISDTIHMIDTVLIPKLPDINGTGYRLDPDSHWDATAHTRIC